MGMRKSPHTDTHFVANIKNLNITDVGMKRGKNCEFIIAREQLQFPPRKYLTECRADDGGECFVLAMYFAFRPKGWPPLTLYLFAACAACPFPH